MERRFELREAHPYFYALTDIEAELRVYAGTIINSYKRLTATIGSWRSEVLDWAVGSSVHTPCGHFCEQYQAAASKTND